MTATPAPKFVRDLAGKKTSVRAAVDPTAETEHVDQTTEWDWWIDVRTGRYFVTAR
jgi:hypothetical protein